MPKSVSLLPTKSPTGKKKKASSKRTQTGKHGNLPATVIDASNSAAATTKKRGLAAAHLWTLLPRLLNFCTMVMVSIKRHSVRIRAIWMMISYPELKMGGPKDVWVGYSSMDSKYKPCNLQNRQANVNPALAGPDGSGNIW